MMTLWVLQPLVLLPLKLLLLFISYSTGSLERQGFFEGWTRKLNLACLTALLPVPSHSVSSFKPLQALGGNTQQIFDVISNNKKNFIPDLMQVKLKPIPTSFLPGNEPLKYIDSQTSKQEAVQKCFYQKDLYKKQGNFFKSVISFTRYTQALANNNG